MFSMSSNDPAGELPGLLSVASAHTDTVFTHLVDGRLCGFLEIIKGARQQHRHGTSITHGAYTVFGHIFEMVGRQGPVPCSQHCAFHIGKLFRV